MQSDHFIFKVGIDCLFGLFLQTIKLINAHKFCKSVFYKFVTTDNTRFSLYVLNKIVSRAIIIKTKRGEAIDFAIKLLSFFENKAFLSALSEA